MIVIFGKGKVGQGLVLLLSFLQKDYVMMDDGDYDDIVLRDANCIIVSPGIKPQHRVYRDYLQKTIGELDYIASLLPTLSSSYHYTFIGITGTNGKSTTSWILYQLLQKIFPSNTSGCHVWLTGNFDVPLSETIYHILQSPPQTQHICVIETSSFMLYRMRHFVFDYSILLNIARDHLDWHGNMSAYEDAKITICSHTKQCFISERFYSLLPPIAQKHTIIISDDVDISHTQFVGYHNIQNFAAAVSLLRQLCYDRGKDIDFLPLLHDIRPLEHRLQDIKIIDGIHIIDDGISTSAQSLSAALSSFNQPVVLIAGGYNKGDDYTILMPLFAQHVAHLVCIGGTTSLFIDLAHQAGISVVAATDLQNAIDQALLYAKNLQVSTVLFSPGAASFDMFTNVYDRIDQFSHIVQSL